MTFSIEPSLSGYQGERAVNFFERTLQAMQSIPGVRSVSATDVPLMTSNRAMYTLVIEGYTPKERENTNADVNMVAPASSRRSVCRSSQAASLHLPIV